MTPAEWAASGATTGQQTAAGSPSPHAERPPDAASRCLELEAALAEKEATLRELQHRAKNSLQLVISLLRLQHHRIADPVAKAAYDQTMHRVEVLAILYRQVHEARSETSVELAHYVREVAETAVANMDSGRPPALTVEVQPQRCSLYTAMPMGLIVNELVAQALRGAFPPEGWLTVRLERLPTGESRLTVTSNGRGLPTGFDAEADAAAMLVEALATQLGADLDIAKGPGTSTRLTLPL